MAGRSYAVIFDTLAEARVKVGRDHVTVEDAVALCESGFGYDVAMIAASIADLTEELDDALHMGTSLLQKQGMNVMLASAEHPDGIDEAVDLLLMYQPDLMIVLATNLKSHARERCEAAGAPVFFFNRMSADGPGFGVSCEPSPSADSTVQKTTGDPAASTLSRARDLRLVACATTRSDSDHRRRSTHT